MMDDFGGIMYILNNIIFIVLVTLFYLLGLKVANRTFRHKKKNKKEFYSIAMASPVGFLIGFFVIDSIYHTVISESKFMASSSLIIYWTVVVFAGFIISFVVSLFMIRAMKGEQRRRSGRGKMKDEGN